MRNKMIIVVLLTLSLLCACSSQLEENSDNTNESKVVLSEIESSEEVSVTESVEPDNFEEEAPIPTVSDNIDYYEMYKNDMRRSKEAGVEGVADSRFQLRKKDYAKVWISTDGRISFILDTLYGPFGTINGIDATYSVDGNDYDVKIAFQPNQFRMYVGEWDNDCTILIAGVYEYNHDEQSFTVTTTHEITTVYLDERTYMSIDEYNANRDKSTIPIYDGGEKITFKMVR